MDIQALLRSRLAETYDLHRRYVNPQMVRVLEVLGFDRDYVSGEGAYLVDRGGQRVLDFLSGFGVFNIGRNHPQVKRILHDLLDLNTANLVQMDLGLLSGLLAEALAQVTPAGLDAVFFTNSGTEGVEGALKFARAATGREKIVFCQRAFHGLTLGALSVNGNAEFRARYGPFLPGCEAVPFNDLAALEVALSGHDVAAFIAEPIQGKGVFVPDDDYFPAVRRLCDATGTLFIADEVQTGLGRTGRMFAIDHWQVTPDLLVVSKGLSGGLVPVGAIITRREIHGRVFDSMDRCMAHSNTFGQNDLAMAAGLAALHVLQSEGLVQRAAAQGAALLHGLAELVGRYEMLHEVRGKGLMIALQFGEPASLGLKTGWRLVHGLNEDLFGQMITMPLLAQHHILTQVAGHGLDAVKLLPPLVIGREEVDYFLQAIDAVLAEAHRFPGSAWSTTRQLAIRTAVTRGTAKAPSA
jgi:ornithine--oxo-acid transaminase